MTASATRMLILMLILLEVVDLLVLTVCCSHGLLPVSDPILEEYTAALKIWIMSWALLLHHLEVVRLALCHNASTYARSLVVRALVRDICWPLACLSNAEFEQLFNVLGRDFRWSALADLYHLALWLIVGLRRLLMHQTLAVVWAVVDGAVLVMGTVATSRALSRGNTTWFLNWIMMMLHHLTVVVRLAVAALRSNGRGFVPVRLSRLIWGISAEEIDAFRIWFGIALDVGVSLLMLLLLMLLMLLRRMRCAQANILLMLIMRIWTCRAAGSNRSLVVRTVWVHHATLVLEYLLTAGMQCLLGLWIL